MSAATAADVDRFWTLIDLLGGAATEETVEALVDHLAGLPQAQITSFADQLAHAAHALDTPAHFAQQVRDVSEPSGGAVLPMSPDVFLFARLAVVAAGRATWERVRAHPEQLSGVWHLAEAEDLMFAAEQAWEAHGAAWDHEPPVDLESFSNPVWGDEHVTPVERAALAATHLPPSPAPSSTPSTTSPAAPARSEVPAPAGDLETDPVLDQLLDQLNEAGDDEGRRAAIARQIEARLEELRAIVLALREAGRDDPDA